MSRHLIDLLDELKTRVARMSSLVQHIVEQSIQAVLDADAELARRAIASDERIDEEEVKVEQACIDLLALHQPAAGDLRLITTVIKVNSDLERIADCAVNCAQRVMPVAAAGGYQPPPDLRLMATTVVSNLRDALKAFNLGDVELAKQVVRNDDAVDALYHQIVQDMLARMQSGAAARNAPAELAYVMVAKNLERIADHCTNLAEDVIYIHSGRIVRHRHAG
jgi:phosphate transport system protein